MSLTHSDDIRTTLHIALERAVIWGMIARNPLRGTTRLPTKSRIDPPLTIEQARRFLVQVKGDRLEPLYYLALMMGLRQGEILGLRWQDVDIEAGTLTVAQTVNFATGKPIFGEPKTPRSKRTLIIPGRGGEFLTAHRTIQDLVRRDAGDAWKEHGLVFPTRNGTPIDSSNLWTYFKRHLKAADLPMIRFHDLRHSCATLLLASGVDIQVVRDLLGHTSISTTADLYAHVLPTLREDAARRIGGLLDAESEASGGQSGGQDQE